MSKKIQEKYLKYKTKLNNSPNNPTYEYKINKYTEQFNTIHGAGIDIQKYIDDNNNNNIKSNAFEEQGANDIESNLMNIQNNMSPRTKTTSPDLSTKSTKNTDGENLVDKVIEDLEYSQEELEKLKWNYLNYRDKFMNKKDQFLEDSEIYLNNLKKEYNLFVAISDEAKIKFDKEISTFHEKMDELRKRTF